jgi:hypothetical protein
MRCWEALWLDSEHWSVDLVRVEELPYCLLFCPEFELQKPCEIRLAVPKVDLLRGRL